MLLNPERNTNVRTPSKYLLPGLIHCGTCGGRMLSRPRGGHPKGYLCAGRRPGHQLGILAELTDDVVKDRVLALLTTRSVRDALLAQTGTRDDRSLGRTLAELGSAQSRLQCLDDDFYVRGVLAEGRYRSIRVKLEREIELVRLVVERVDVTPGRPGAVRFDASRVRIRLAPCIRAVGAAARGW